MTTELDELAARAENDPSLSSAGLDKVIVSVILQTRRHWITMPDQYFSSETATGVELGCAALAWDGRPVYEES